ncbi:MAG: prepilin peptidase, partial [Candidatus Aenigmarchaeota archaeon]|nr:prepilin peptidase [Candidatus Aenigmarchaeota archaeon]
IIGSAIAGLWDLKTTEVPDWLPIGMVAGGLIFWYFWWVIAGDAYPLTISFTIGTLVLGLGLLLYYKKQWGEADAWILAAVAYMIPLYNNSQIFFYDYIFNFLIVSLAYLLVYSIVLGLKNKNVMKIFAADVRAKWYIILAPPIAAGILATIVPGTLFVALMLLGLMLFWRYALAVENNVFKRKIHTSNLKEGDVLVDKKWLGVTKDDIEKLKKEKDYVMIKDGVRFVPVFAITIVVTLLWGNVFAALFF